MKVCSQRPIMIDQTVHRDVDLDDVILPSVMITRFTQLKHFVKVIIFHARLFISCLILCAIATHIPVTAENYSSVVHSVPTSVPAAVQ